MKARYLAALAAAAVLGGSLVATTPAAAAAKYAGTGIAQTGGTPLNMRRTPSSAGERLGEVTNGGTVWIMCQIKGDRITGAVRTTDVWLRLANNTYVSDGYVRRASFPIPACASAPVVMPPVSGAWQLPVAAGLVSGFHTAQRPTHAGVDLGATRNTPIRAASAGSVIRVVCNVSQGTCDVDGNRGIAGCGWYVEVQHAGNIVTRYCHMVRRPSVVVGQRVAKGQILGYVGTSGSSSGPHLHFEVHVNAPPATSANAVSPITFMRARGLVIK
ncbi:peptidoglycan DD-metalloendopeptidase family protein [Actinoplanes sp. TBRC 11911]|uniref:M23 family metallopeptidase n=1 Tax=Actinoplanes sp. TBRC 11911 TaxID=2729386 RepID=UPI00289E6451|nr:peptidoglycan DD-metalloendopeptidase family protein [Actinoplanes sp. TBRC 11911]